MFTIKTIRGVKEYNQMDRGTWLDAFLYASEIVQNQRGDALDVKIIKWGSKPTDDVVEAHYSSQTCKWSYRGN